MPSLFERFGSRILQCNRLNRSERRIFFNAESRDRIVHRIVSPQRWFACQCEARDASWRGANRMATQQRLLASINNKHFV